MMRWEYCALKATPDHWSSAVDAKALDIAMNALGEKGWELVTNLSVAGGTGRTEEAHLLFKRPLQETTEGSPLPKTV